MTPGSVPPEGVKGCQAVTTHFPISAMLLMLLFVDPKAIKGLKAENRTVQMDI